jgi:hypothetical protein
MELNRWSWITEYAVTEVNNLERRAGIEPANTGFADLRVSRFATGACGTVVKVRKS